MDMEQKNNQVEQEGLLHCRNCDGYYDPSLPNCPHCGEDTANNINDTITRDSVTQYAGGFGEAGSTLSRVAAGMVVALLAVGLLASVVFGVKMVSNRRSQETGAEPLPVSSAEESAPPQEESSAAPAQEEKKEETEKQEEPKQEEPAQLPPEAIRLDYNDLTLVNEGETYQFQVSVDPEDWDGVLTWTTDNQNVAVVSPEGKVKSVGRGECGITISAGEVSYRCVIRCKSGAAAEEGGSASVESYYMNGKLYTLEEAEQARKKAEEERKKKEAEKKKKAEEKAKKKAEKEAKKKAEEEARKKAEEEAKKKAEEEAQKKAEEEQKKAEEEEKKKAEEEEQKKAEEEEKKKAEEEAAKQAEKEKKKQEEAQKKAAEEAAAEKERQAAEKKAAEEEKKKKSNSNSITLQYYDITLVHVGEGFKFTPSGGDGKSYSWSSANDGVASVSSDGYVKATGVGQTTLTCTSGGTSVDVVVRVRSN